MIERGTARIMLLISGKVKPISENQNNFRMAHMRELPVGEQLGWAQPQRGTDVRRPILPNLQTCARASLLNGRKRCLITKKPLATAQMSEHAHSVDVVPQFARLRVDFAVVPD